MTDRHTLSHEKGVGKSAKMRGPGLFLLVAFFVGMACAASGKHFRHAGASGGDAFCVKGGPTTTVEVLPKGQVPVGCTAFGQYLPAMSFIGWDAFAVESNSTADDLLQAYTAGYGEGWFTAEASVAHNTNMASFLNSSQKVYDWFQQNLDYMDAQTNSSATHPAAEKDFWYQVTIAFKYFNGIYDGTVASLAAKKLPNPFTRLSFYILSNLPDIFDVQGAFGEQGVNKRPDWRKMSKKDYDVWFASNSHCSALIKILPDFSDIFFGHITWMNLVIANRVLKEITLNLNGGATVAKTIGMSSYPGALTSQDDFHMLGSGFVVIETSLEVLNTSIYVGNVVPQSVLYGYRVLAASRMATSGLQWSQLFSLHNSGTYNNEWLVLNLNLFTPGKALVPGTFYLLDQMPGKITYADYTTELALGYFPSYNVPAFVDIFNYAGYPEAVKIQGPQMNDYQMCVRAQIFRRDQAKVKDLDSMKFMLQYNDYEQDPISEGNPVYAIAARGDLLVDPHPMCFGGLDTKVSSYQTYKKEGVSFHAFAGLTPQQPVLMFNTTRAQCGSHLLIPNKFEFSWVVF